MATRAVATAANITVPSARSTSLAGTSAAGSPTARLTVVNVTPRLNICGMIRSRAATVSDRSPPASCSSTMPPVDAACMVDVVMPSTPGRAQSALSTSTSAVT